MPSLHKHSGFTMIEMILVVVILGLLMTMDSSLFVATDNSTYYAETCANHLYGAIKSYQYGALVGKRPESGSALFDDISTYTIVFDTAENLVHLQYATGDANISYKQISLTDTDPQRLCSSDSYAVVLTGSPTLTLTMTKNFSQYNDQPAITLFSGVPEDQNTVATGSITLIQQSHIDGSIKEISQIHIDTRNQNITHHDCYIFDRATGTCNKRQQ